LRSEFAKWRQYSLRRRKNKFNIKKILLTLGGTDKDNYTKIVLKELTKTSFYQKVMVTIVMGKNAPHLDKIKKQVASMRGKIEIKTDVAYMAKLMANSDLAIGAAGSTSWERACLGLPTMQIVIAENQKQTARALVSDEIVVPLEDIKKLTNLFNSINNDKLKILINNSSRLVDGLGAKKVAKIIHRKNDTNPNKKF